MKIKQTMGIVLISVVLLSATALAATPAVKPAPVQKLKAVFTATHNAKTPLTEKFTDKSTGSPTSWAWNFGDKSPIVKTKNATHTYKKAGKYTITLTVKKGKEMSKATKVINLIIPKK